MKEFIRLLPPSYSYALRRCRFMLTHREQYKKLSNLRKGISSEGYTLKPFDDLQAIFIHIPKNAGQSIRSSLFENLLPGHLNVYTYQLIFPKRLFDRYFKFAFTRNPWDRLVSAYTFMKSGGAHEKDRLWSEKLLSRFSGFEHFVQEGLREAEIQAWPHFRPQVEFLKGQGGGIEVDFLGRFENIDRDFEIVCQQLGIERELLHINKTKAKRESYQSYYSAESREIASQIYSQDIAEFDYDF